MLPGVMLHPIKKNIDGRGFFAELLRRDWKDIIGEDRIEQINLSESIPGVIRAWHRHSRGQVDYLVAIKGKVRVCIFNGEKDSATKGQLDEIILDSKKSQILRIPGFYWHGTKCVGRGRSMVIYFMTKLYDYKNPDEERKQPDDPSIIDTRTGDVYDWNR